MSTTTRYTIIGAGHGGKAMAAHLALMDFHVTLYNRTPGHVAAIAARGGIDVESYDGGPRGFGQLALVTSDMQEALAGADVVMVVVPSIIVMPHGIMRIPVPSRIRVGGRIGIGNAVTQRVAVKSRATTT